MECDVFGTVLFQMLLSGIPVVIIALGLIAFLFFKFIIGKKCCFTLEVVLYFEFSLIDFSFSDRQDFNKLKWEEVRDEGTDQSGRPMYRIVFKQKKTDGVEYLYISKQARDLLGERRKPEDRVFNGLCYSAHMNIQLLKWCMQAGITKHITFHSARHTNAVLLLENGADIYTVSKRLGHREIRTTQIYAKIIDEKMKQAAEMLPKLNLETMGLS